MNFKDNDDEESKRRREQLALAASRRQNEARTSNVEAMVGPGNSGTERETDAQASAKSERDGSSSTENKAMSMLSSPPPNDVSRTARVTPIAAEQASKKPRKSPRPAQILADALSQVTQCCIEIGDYTSRSHQQSRRVPLLIQGESWTELLPSLDNCLKHYNQALKAGSLQQAAERHARALDVARGQSEVKPAMEMLQAFLVKQAADELVRDFFQHRMNSDSIQEGDLFANEVSDESKPETGYLSQFWKLLEFHPALCKPFLSLVLQDNVPQHVIENLCQELVSRSQLSLQTPSSQIHETLQHRINAVQNAVAFVPELVQAMTLLVQKEVASSNDNWTGNELEQSLSLRFLLSLAAYTVPNVGQESNIKNQTTFTKQLESIPRYPVSLFEESNKDSSQIISCTVSTMQLASQVGASVLKSIFKNAKQDGFAWLANLGRANEALCSMNKTELLSSNGVRGITSSMSLLLGTLSCLLSFCGENLRKRFDKQPGAHVFDVRYLTKLGRLDIAANERRLISTTDVLEQRDLGSNVQFTGATELFFLASNLLRVALDPALRIQQELEKANNSTLTTVQSAASNKRLDYPESATPIVSAWLGWQLFLEKEEEFTRRVVDFVLLQLEWLLALARSGSGLDLIPEWMIKQPMNYLAFTARRMPNFLKPLQAERGVELITELLQLGVGSTEHAAFSPLVSSKMIQVLADFVNAGISRAKTDKRRTQKTSGQSEDLDEDDKNLDVYLSFDRNNLAVTVFTTRLASSRLCPLLMELFTSLDIVEGLDVDRDNFDKFQEKVRVASLLLRLIGHPNGECRASIAALPEEAIARFASSVAAAVGYLLDDACHRLTDISRARSSKSTAFLQSQSKGAINGLYMSRTLLLFLCRLSEDERLAAVMGGNHTASSDLATMVLHFLDLLTENTGKTSDSICMRRVARAEFPSSSTPLSKAEYILRGRVFANQKFGLDVSLICHELLALGTCWHKNASNASRSQTSPFLNSLVSNDDFNLEHLRNIFLRLVRTRGTAKFDGFEKPASIIDTDGYLDLPPTFTLGTLEIDPSNSDEEGLRTLASTYQLSHKQIERVATTESIDDFVKDLSAAHFDRASKTSKMLSLQEVAQEESRLLALAGEECISETNYTSKLKEWIVSSEPFSDRHASSQIYSHFYDGSARAKSSTGSGKALGVEARRCFRTLPDPHPNGACFVCFAEERMDLCRGVITGPTNTPYAHGIFVFDVFFPSLYPHVPPLLTFMNTGGGQTRINPNIYQDGKVCISLLGTWHASDESQKWNPAVSSLAQVLLSIQTQLLVKEPYFNEPGYERTQHTIEGREGSARYNDNIRLATLRHAIIAPIRDPPRGFEEVARRHFGMCRRRILLQAKVWTGESAKTPLFPRFQRAYQELVSLLGSEDLKGHGCLMPIERDVAILAEKNQHLRSVFARLYRWDEHEQEIAMETVWHCIVLDAAVEAYGASNPWAFPMESRPTAQRKSDDPDEELYD